MNMHRWGFPAALFVLAACGGSDSDGQGRVDFSTWGEEYIEDAIPAEDVEDGWTLRFTKFLIVLGRVRVAETADGAAAAEMGGFKLFDMTQAGAKPVVSFAELPAKPYRFVSFEVAPATTDVELAGATDADKERMVTGGYSVYVDGSATKDGVEKTFSWGFSERSVYERCSGERGGRPTEGVVVTTGGTADPEITIHGDHLFYDDPRPTTRRFASGASPRRTPTGTASSRRRSSRRWNWRASRSPRAATGRAAPPASTIPCLRDRAPRARPFPWRG